MYTQFAIHDVWKIYKHSKMGTNNFKCLYTCNKQLLFQTAHLFIKLFLFSCSTAFTTAQISKLTNEHKPLSVNMQSLGLKMSFL